MTFLNRILMPRALNWLAFLVCALSIVAALIMQYGFEMEPCPLCIFQRLAVIAAGLIFLLAALHGPKSWGRRVYGFAALVAVGVGAALAIRHLWLQSLPPDKVPSCGPGLDYLYETFPLHEVIAKVLHGSGECAAIQGHFLGLTLPGWTLLLFIALGAVAVMQLLRRDPPANCPHCRS